MKITLVKEVLQNNEIQTEIDEVYWKNFYLSFIKISNDIKRKLQFQ